MAPISWTQATRLQVIARLAGEMRRALRRNESARLYELAGLVEMVSDSEVTFLRLNEDRFTDFFPNGSTTVLSKEE